MALNVHITTQLSRDEEKVCMEVEEEGDYKIIPIATVTTRMTLALRSAAMKTINVSLIVKDKVTGRCPQTTTFFTRK